MWRKVQGEVGTQFNCKNVKTSSLSFKLLTKITVILLAASAVIVTLGEVFGEAITCVLSDNHQSYKHAIELKCWLEGVFVDRNLLNGTYGSDIISTGVGTNKRGNKPEYILQNFYQWVSPVLFLLALFLLLPRVLWRILGGDAMEKLMDKGDSLVVDDEWKQKKPYILSYLRQCPGSEHRKYFFKYLICECLGIFCLIADMLIMHCVFNDFWSEFLPAVTSVLGRDLTSFRQNAAKLFPMQAKCIFNMFGPSGSIQEFDVVCILPQNTVNEKIFVFLYLWMILMLIVSVLNMVLTFSKLIFKPLRVRDVLIMSDLASKRITEKFVLKYSDVGYWHLLHLLQRNLSTLTFQDVVDEELSPVKVNDSHPQAPQATAEKVALDGCGCCSLGQGKNMRFLSDPMLVSCV